MILRNHIGTSLIRLIAVFGAVVMSNAAHADSYKLDASHTAIVFQIKHMQFSYTYGRFNEIEGQFTTGQDPSFVFTVKTASIDTGFPKRDDHLRSPDFFNAKQFPVISFASTVVQVHGDEVHLTGDLSLHGVTKSIHVNLLKMGEGDDPWGNYRAGYSTTFTIKRSDFGMTGMADLIGDEVQLMISFEGIRQ